MMQIVVSDIVTLRERYGIIGGGTHRTTSGIWRPLRLLIIPPAVIGVGYAIGPPIGGALSQHVGWQMTRQFKSASKLLAVDYLGAFLTLAGCTLFILPLIWRCNVLKDCQGGVTFPWKSVVLAPLLSSMAVVALFCFSEWKGARLPIVPMYIFRHATVTGVFIAMFVKHVTRSFFAAYPDNVAVASSSSPPSITSHNFFKAALGYNSLHAGIFLIPFLVVQSIASWLAMIIQLGFGIWAIACGCISTIRPGSHKALLVVYMVVAGSGSGQTMPSVPKRDMSVITAMRQFIRLLGGTLSLAVASTLVNNKLRTAMTVLNMSAADINKIIDDPALLHTPAKIGLSQATATEILDNGFTKGFSAMFIINAAMTVLATIVSVVLIKHKELAHEEKTNSQPVNGEEKQSAVTPMESGAATPSNLEAGTIAPHGDIGDIEMATLLKESMDGAV
ncbi:hypothetical protein B0H13DRAFT_1892105 [Mycena leptocephala]|nr:hypothetical protein B0H13DRAFT_1892105 [Mycena leptocephala]